jgi:hypothetical protein
MLKSINLAVSALTASIEQYEANRDAQVFFNAVDPALDQLRPSFWITDSKSPDLMGDTARTSA